MTRRTISLIFLALLTLFASACGPEAKKKRAIEGGNKYFEKGQYKQARLMYLNAVKADPRFGEAYYKLALTNLRLGSPGAAVGNLQRAIELQPENLDAISRLADILLGAYSSNPAKYKNLMPEIRELAERLEKRGKGSYEQLRLQGFVEVGDGKLEEGLALFRAADAKKPGQATLQVTIARTLLFLKRFDEAESYLRGLVEKDKTFGAGYDLLYAIAMMQNKPEVAEQVLVQRLENNPKIIANRMRLAAHYFTRQRGEDVEKILAGTLANQKDFPNARMEVGDFYYRTRSFDRAAATYQEGVTQDSVRSLAFQKRLVEVRVAQGRAAEALEMCEKILKDNKNDPEVIAMRASLWLYAGKPEQINTAISELQSVVTKMPDNFVLRYNLGRALMAKGDIDSARVQLTDALRYRPDYLPARIGLAQIQVARGEYAAALSAANEILQLDPSNQWARLIASDTYLAQGKYAESKAALAETLKKDPNQRDVKYRLAYVLFKEGNMKEAETHFRAIYEQNPPDIRGLMGLTEVYSSQKDFDSALRVLEDAMKRFPKSTALHGAWGSIAVRSGRFDDGIASFKKVLAADPRNFDIHMRLAEAYRQKGDLPNAIEYWKKAGEIMPNHTLPVLSRAMALDQVNRKTEAAPLYEQVLRAEPDNVAALNNYSFYLADQGTDLDLALSYIQKAKAKAPSDPMIADTLGFVYLKKNLPQSAMPIFKDLVEKHPKVALFHIRLATAYVQSGKIDLAKRELDAARRNNPSPADKAEIDKLAGKIG